MKILKTNAADDGFYMPAEFSPHSGCILIWPHRRDSWQNGGYAARRAFVELIKIISLSERVTVCARYEDYDEVIVGNKKIKWSNCVSAQEYISKIQERSKKKTKSCKHSKRSE